MIQALMTLLLLLSPSFSMSFAPSKKVAFSNADVALEALFRGYWIAEKNDFRGSPNYWFYALSMDSVTAAAKRGASSKYEKLLKLMIDAQEKRGFLQGAHVYYDDENWMALALARAYQITNRPSDLKNAEILLKDIMIHGTKNLPNSIWWNFERKKQATASNAGPVITAALLYQITRNQNYLEFAQRIYKNWLSKMVNPNTGQVYDQIFADGSIDQTPYSYDQGLMIGASLELFKVTKDMTYLQQARLIASYMLTHMKSHQGVMLEQTCIKYRRECLTWKDVGQFKGIGFWYLAQLYKVDKNYIELKSYLDQTATAIMSPQVFDRQKNQFAYEWDGSEPPSTGMYSTANSAALAMAAYASLFQ